MGWKGFGLVRGQTPLCGRSGDQATGTPGYRCDYCEDGMVPSVLIRDRIRVYTYYVLVYRIR